MPTVAVFGATGTQGGSVVRRLLQTSSGRWHVRAITRDVGSEKARQLAGQGAEVVAANVDDHSSLPAAVAGAEAVFGITFFWDAAFSIDFENAGPIEENQIKNIARALAASPSLRHFVISTLPSAEKASAGRLKVPHFDYKQRGLDWVRENLPKLWAKTTEYWPGFYMENLMAQNLQFKELPAAKVRYLLLPSKPEAMVPIGGSITVNCGVTIEAIFAAGPRAFGKVVIGVTEYRPWSDFAAVYQKITGRSTMVVEATDEEYIQMFGPFGAELAAQFRWSEVYPDLSAIAGDRGVTLKDLGLEGKLVGFEQAMVGMKDFFA